MQSTDKSLGFRLLHQKLAKEGVARSHCRIGYFNAQLNINFGRYCMHTAEIDIVRGSTMRHIFQDDFWFRLPHARHGPTDIDKIRKRFDNVVLNRGYINYSQLKSLSK